MGSKAEPSKEDVMAVVKEYITKTKKIRFEGDGYSAEWHAEANKRGLPNAKNTPEAILALTDPVHQKMLTKDIFTVEELKARYHVLSERYTKDMLIEANTLRSMLFTHVLPVAYDQRGTLAQTVVNLKTAEVSFAPELSVLKQTGDLIAGLQAAGAELINAIEEISEEHEGGTQAADLVPIMAKIRELGDSLEQIIPDKLWPFPKYTELLFSI